MIFNFKKVILDIDVEKTRKIYKNLPYISDNCQCDGCNNFMLAIDDFPKNVLDFFDNLGVDIKKATEIITWNSENCGKTLHYGGFYHVCGKIISNADSTFINKDITNNFFTISDGYDVCFTNDVSLKEDVFSLPIIQIEIDFYNVNWKLEKVNIY